LKFLEIILHTVKVYHKKKKYKTIYNVPYRHVNNCIIWRLMPRFKKVTSVQGSWGQQKGNHRGNRVQELYSLPNIILYIYSLL
jgi:hypothetical protein